MLSHYVQLHARLFGSMRALLHAYPVGSIFQRQLSIIKFTLNYPPIRNNLTSASLLSMLIETDYLNYPAIRNNLSSASLPCLAQVRY